MICMCLEKRGPALRMGTRRTRRYHPGNDNHGQRCIRKYLGPGICGAIVALAGI